MPIDLLGNIISYETGELSAPSMVVLFAYLVKTGLVWSLQGSYGRVAKALIEKGYINAQGETNVALVQEALHEV